jgi:pyruvate,water dikinase
VAFVRRAQERLVTVCLAHYLARLFSTPAMEKLDALSLDDDLAFGLLSDLDGLEATAPTLALLDLSQQVRPDGTIDELALDGFLERFGHRGTSELDPGASVWADRRDEVRRRIVELAEVDQASMLRRRSSVRAEAERRLADLGWFKRIQLRQTAKACRSISALGETTKDQLVRAVHTVRVALQQVSARAGLDYEDAVLLSWDELVGRLTAEGTGIELDLDARRTSLERAGRQTPFLYRREDTEEQMPYPVGGTELRGIAASPGVAVGRSVIVHDPLEDIAEGEILVATSTDTAWTHLFLTHDAVVTETGDLLSHSSIVARDLGIPAVVAVPEATTRLKAGDRTTVDGNEGLVVTS